MKNIFSKVVIYLLVCNCLSNIFAQGSNAMQPNIAIQDQTQSIAELKYSFTGYSFCLNNTSLDEVFNQIISDSKPSYKSPFLAFTLSLLYPGLGQLYNAEYGKAFLMAGLGTVGAGLIMLGAASINYDSGSNPEYINYLIISGAVLYGGIYLWSLIDAPLSADGINQNITNTGLKIFSTEDMIVLVSQNKRIYSTQYLINIGVAL